MGLNILKRQAGPDEPIRHEMGSVESRFGTHYPRLFAYVRTSTGADLPAQDIVVEAFAQAFRKSRDAGEEQFLMSLYRTARQRCRSFQTKERHPDDPLTRDERDMISLVFDAGLTRRQISKFFGVRETRVNSLVMKGLRKLKTQASPAATAAYLKFA